MPPVEPGWMLARVNRHTVTPESQIWTLRTAPRAPSINSAPSWVMSSLVPGLVLALTTGDLLQLRPEAVLHLRAQPCGAEHKEPLQLGKVVAALGSAPLLQGEPTEQLGHVPCCLLLFAVEGKAVKEGKPPQKSPLLGLWWCGMSPFPMTPKEGQLRDSLNLPVDDAEQLMASGDGDRLREQIRGGERVLVPRGQRQELAELAVERTGRAAADAVESIFQELEDLVL